MTDSLGRIRGSNDVRKTAAAAIGSGEIQQMTDGRAAVYVGLDAAASGDKVGFQTEGVYALTKTSGVVLLDGGKAYWDWSANAVTFKKVNDRDFYLGTIVGDAASTDTTVAVNMNNHGRYLLDLARDPFTTVLVAGGLLNRRGGANNLQLASTSEAEKSDALSDDGFAISATNGFIAEAAFKIVDGDAAGAADFNIGVASATHATDADSIAQHLFMHVDGNSTAIKFQSKDGTNTTAATDSTTVYVVGTRKEVWMDARNPAAVKLYVDGVQVLAATVFNISAAALTFYLLAHLEKTSSTDTFQGNIDWLRARTFDA